MHRVIQFFARWFAKTYWDEILPGDKYLRYMHRMRITRSDGSDALESVLAYVTGFPDDRPQPTLPGSSKAQTRFAYRPRTSRKVLLWHMTKSKRTRLPASRHWENWKSSELFDQGGGVYWPPQSRSAGGLHRIFIEARVSERQIVPCLGSLTQVRVVRTPTVCRHRSQDCEVAESRDLNLLPTPVRPQNRRASRRHCWLARPDCYSLRLTMRTSLRPAVRSSRVCGHHAECRRLHACDQPRVCANPPVESVWEFHPRRIWIHVAFAGGSRSCANAPARSPERGFGAKRTRG